MVPFLFFVHYLCIPVDRLKTPTILIWLQEFCLRYMKTVPPNTYQIWSCMTAAFRRPTSWSQEGPHLWWLSTMYVLPNHWRAIEPLPPRQQNVLRCLRGPHVRLRPPMSKYWLHKRSATIPLVRRASWLGMIYLNYIGSFNISSRQSTWWGWEGTHKASRTRMYTVRLAQTQQLDTRYDGRCTNFRSMQCIAHERL